MNGPTGDFGDSTPLVSSSAPAKTSAAISGSSSLASRIWWAVFGGLTLFDMAGIIVIAVLGSLIGYYASQTADAKTVVDRRLNAHFGIIEVIQARIPEQGPPWYEAVDVPNSCLDSWIVRQETRAGFRP